VPVNAFNYAIRMSYPLRIRNAVFGFTPEAGKHCILIAPPNCINYALPRASWRIRVPQVAQELGVHGIQLDSEWVAIAGTSQSG